MANVSGRAAGAHPVSLSSLSWVMANNVYVEVLPSQHHSLIGGPGSSVTDCGWNMTDIRMICRTSLSHNSSYRAQHHSRYCTTPSNTDYSQFYKHPAPTLRGQSSRLQSSGWEEKPAWSVGLMTVCAAITPGLSQKSRPAWRVAVIARFDWCSISFTSCNDSAQ